MKKIMLVPALLGLLLTACSQDDSQKIASSSSSNSSSSATANNPSAQDKKEMKSDAAASIAAAPTPAPEAKASTDVAVNSPITPPNTAIVSSPSITPSATPTPITEDAAKPSTTPTATPASSEGGTASIGSASIATRIAEWKLTPTDIKDEFEKTGRIERSKSPPPGAPTGPMDSGVLMGLVRSRFDSDPVIAALKLSIEANANTITLSGTAHGLDQIGRAVAFALDTDGVNNAVSLIKLESAPQ